MVLKAHALMILVKKEASQRLSKIIHMKLKTVKCSKKQYNAVFLVEDLC